MSYESPITMYTDRIIKDIVEKQDGYLMECVHKVGFDINKEELAKALEYDRDQYDKGFHDGRMYKPTIMTNADRIRAMTDEELAFFFFHYGDCTIIEKPENCTSSKSCVDCWLDWLKQEADMREEQT